MKKHAFRHGCFLALVFLIGGVGVVRFAAYPFMSPNAPIAAPVLVIEGWMEDEQIQEAVAWAETNGVETIYTTGGPLSQGIVFGTSVACPLHNWTIGLDSGCAKEPDEGCTPRFAVKVEGGLVSLNAAELAGHATDLTRPVAGPARRTVSCA